MAKLDPLTRFLRAVPTLEDEVAPYRGLTPEAKLALVKAACVTGEKLLAMNPDASRIRAHRDPWPASTVALLRPKRR